MRNPYKLSAQGKELKSENKVIIDIIASVIIVLLWKGERAKERIG